MAWNGPVNGDYSNCDFNKPPWVGGCAVLTHEEVVFVWETTEQFRVQKPWDDSYIVSEYNKFVNWEKAINGDTYNVIKTYDFEVNTLGIDENGVVQPAEPVEETPTEEPIPSEEV